MEDDNNDSSSGDSGEKTQALTKKRSRGPSRFDNLEGKSLFPLEGDEAGCLMTPIGQDAFMEDDNNGSCSGDSGEKTPAPKKRRPRGPSNLENLEGKGPFPLEWDEAGCPIGKYAISFASYCGKRVRRQVHINHSDWGKDVDIGLKNLLWEDISRKFLVDEKHKEYVLSSCAAKWRNFKAKLTSRFIRDKHPLYDSPADCYSFIERADWEEFKNTRETDEFKERSKKAAESVKHHKHPHLMGRRGYNLRVPDWIAAECSKSSSSPKSSSPPKSSNSLVNDRSWRWMKGRTKSDGNIPNEKTKQVSEQMDEWRKKIDSGEFVPDRYDDVLARSLNKKEHPGRVRGFGVGVTIKDVFGASRRAPQTAMGLSDQEVAELTERVRKETIESLRHIIRREIRQETLDLLKQLGVDLPQDLEKELQSSCQLANLSNIFLTNKEYPSWCTSEELKEPTKCQLACLHDGETFTVAIATIYPSEDSSNQLIHGEPLLHGNAKVCIDEVLEGNAPLPFPTQYLERVEDATGSFVQWPKKLIIIEKESLTDDLLALNEGKQASEGSCIKHRSRMAEVL